MCSDYSRRTNTRFSDVLADMQIAYEDTEGDEFRILDLGCGECGYHDDIEDMLPLDIEDEYFSSKRDRNVKVIGLDRFMRANIDKVNEGIEYDLTEGYIPLKDNCMDYVMSNNAMYQFVLSGSVETKQKVLEESERILKEGGRQSHNNFRGHLTSQSYK